MKKKDLLSVLRDEIDEEVLKRAPKWLRLLREAYEKRYKKASVFP